MQVDQLEATAMAKARGDGSSHQVGAIEAREEADSGIVWGGHRLGLGFMGEGGEEAECVPLALWLTCLGCLARAAGDRMTREALGFQMELSQGQLDITTQHRGEAWGASVTGWSWDWRLG